MATRTVSYKICDGCLRDELRDGIEIVRSETSRPYLDSDHSTADICADCVEAECYHCRLCGRVHSDENACEQQRRYVNC